MLPITECYSVEFRESCVSDLIGKAGSKVRRFACFCVGFGIFYRLLRGQLLEESRVFPLTITISLSLVLTLILTLNPNSK